MTWRIPPYERAPAWVIVVRLTVVLIALATVVVGIRWIVS